MENCQNWFYLCLVLCGLLFLALVMSFGYNFWLDKRTLKLEKKNGKEQKEIDELKRKVERLEGTIKKGRS